jgi:hypothetical protein
VSIFVTSADVRRPGTTWYRYVRIVSSALGHRAGVRSCSPEAWQTVRLSARTP